MTGFTSKRQAALDKLFEVENELGLHYDQRTPMTKDEALTLEALKYAASMGHGDMVKEMFAPFTIKSTLAQPDHIVDANKMAQPAQEPLTDKQILADETLRYYFGQNGGAGPVSKQGRKVVNAIEALHGIKEKNT